jgi:hypothetical protein
MIKDYRGNKDFFCSHCHAYITSDPLISGVQNRNHCPYCLWSRHLDLFKAGDRLSACRGLMQPVGLSIKKSYKKYSSPTCGELMLVHRCRDCGNLSLNRIAADDDSDTIFTIFKDSLTNREIDSLDEENLYFLGINDTRLVYSRLFGSISPPPVELIETGENFQEILLEN